MNNNLLKVYIFLVICFFIPSTAYAYLDPGTGNALVYVALSLLGTILYFIKGLFYKIIKRKEYPDTVDNSAQNSIVIFCEGKSYWKIFKPVVEKLMERQCFFSYYTMDRKDPCLMIDNPFMDNHYIGSGNSAYVKIGKLNANVVLVTTPNIGTEGYPIPRSRGIKKLVYMPHSFGDVAFLHRGALDNYDAYVLTGEFQIPSIRKIEKIRNLPEKELYPAGSPHIEELIQKANCNDATVIRKEFSIIRNVTVLLAPSWGEKGFLSYYSFDFIKKLADEGFHLILRPHPQSLKVEKKLLQNVEYALKDYNNIVMDYQSDATKSFEAADILVSDVSEIRFEFAMAYQKPFITIPLAMTQEALQEFEIADLGSSWTEEAMQKIGYGYTLQENEIDNLDQIIMKVLQQKSNEAILDFRKRNIYNLGHSGEVIADYLIEANNRIQNEMKRDTD
ncbi:CDP-glycerol glycerophosphotransferase family protein [uncultured Succiniclasticum sp.]|uniref:CDP-glycerol glycerophosphotransferase family protein n=1 Tax=uncultured Succiniclasticum sp. TaxID=1500547 RepID=UPI0025F950FF|nr:CDP-glycerol glycerophosphotransferase family protein [uncultured Succiniclasticum sp.]